MKKSKITILNQLIEAYPQFKEPSLLLDSVYKTLNCGYEDAKNYITTHCNMASLWAILKASNYTDKGYSDFFKWMLNKGYTDAKGYIYAKKSEIMRELKISDYTDKYFEEYEDVLNPVRLNPDKFYQMKIKGNTEGFHFMACYVLDDVLYLSDTSYRGIGVKAEDHITAKNFMWMREY